MAEQVHAWAALCHRWTAVLPGTEDIPLCSSCAASLEIKLHVCFLKNSTSGTDFSWPVLRGCLEGFSRKLASALWWLGVKFPAVYAHARMCACSLLEQGLQGLVGPPCSRVLGLRFIPLPAQVCGPNSNPAVLPVIRGRVLCGPMAGSQLRWRQAKLRRLLSALLPRRLWS